MLKRDSWRSGLLATALCVASLGGQAAANPPPAATPHPAANSSPATGAPAQTASGGAGSATSIGWGGASAPTGSTSGLGQTSVTTGWGLGTAPQTSGFGPGQTTNGATTTAAGQMSGVGGGSHSQVGSGVGPNFSNGGVAGVSEDADTSTGGGTTSGTQSASANTGQGVVASSTNAPEDTATESQLGYGGAGATGGSPGTQSQSNGQDSTLAGAAVSHAAGVTWAAIAPGAPSTDSSQRAVAGVRGDTTGMQTYGAGGPNAAGQVINRGNVGGGDAGSGQTAQGTSTGGSNATGQTVNAGNAANGDASLHPATQTGAIRATVLNNGVSNPQPTGH